MKRNLVYAILGIGVIGVCFSLIMFRGNKETSVIEEPTVTIEQVQEEVVVDINDVQPDTELDIEVEEVVEEEVKIEAEGVFDEPLDSIVEPQAPTESIVEPTESIEEVEAIEQAPVETPAVVESTPVEAPTQEPVQEQAKPVESSEIQEVYPATSEPTYSMEEMLQKLEAAGRGINDTSKITIVSGENSNGGTPQGGGYWN